MTRTNPDNDPNAAKMGEVLIDLLELTKAPSARNATPLEEIDQQSTYDNEEARENLGGDAAELLEKQPDANKPVNRSISIENCIYALPNFSDMVFAQTAKTGFGVAGKTDGKEQPVGMEQPVGKEQPAEEQPLSAKPGDGKAVSKGDLEPAKAIEKPAAVRLREFDANFDEVLKQFEKEIETEKVGLNMMSEVLRKAQVETLSVRIKTGSNLALVDEMVGKGDKSRVEQYRKQLDDLSKLDKAAQIDERRVFDYLPDGIKARSMKAAFQIASGKDEHVNKGEIELCRLVKENPQLATNNEFRKLVLLSYSEMAATRQLRGLGEWRSKVQVDDLVGKKDDAAKADPIDLLKKANETFFQDGGIEKATPFFEQAIFAQKVVTQEGDRKRLELFISSLSQDIKIAQDGHQEKDVDDLIRKRIGHRDLEQKAVADALSAKDLDTSLRANFAFARIATGKPALYEAAVKDLMSCLKDNPSMSFDEGFQENCRQAFKAHTQNLTAIQLAEAAGKEEPKPLYSELDLKKLSKNGALKDDAKLQSYWIDDVTGPALLALGLGLALAQFARTRNKYHAADIMKSGLDAASKVVPVEGLGSDVRAERKSSFSGEVGKYEVKGSARDGRMVLLKDSTGTTPSDKAPEFKEIKPGKAFSPETLQFGEYIPIEVNGKKFFADKDGRAYKYERKMFSEPRLYEDSETRQIELVARKEVESILPEVKVDPNALDMTHEHPQKAMPKEWQTEFDFIRDVKRAFAANDTHVTSRLETLDRAIKSLNSTEYGDRQQFLAELERQMKPVGIKVEYTDAPKDGGTHDVKVYLSLEGSNQRLVIFADKDKPPAIEFLDKGGKVTKTETGTVKVADQLKSLEKAVTAQLKVPSVKDKLRTVDPELALDASNKEVRRSFLDGLSRTWRDAREQTLRFTDAVRKSDAGSLKTSIEKAMIELGKAPPAVTERALRQIEKEMRKLGVEAKADIWRPASGDGEQKATLSVLAPDGKTKLLFFSDGQKPGLEANGRSGVVAYDDAAFNKAIDELSNKVTESAKKVSGEHITRTLAERIGKAPKGFQAGLNELLKAGEKGNKSANELAERILLLHENGKEIPKDIKMYLGEEYAGEIAENAKVLNDKAGTAVKGHGLKETAYLAGSGPGVSDRLPGSTDRYDSLNLFNQQGKKPRDLLVRISYTTTDGVTHQKLVSLHEIPPEALEDRLNRLNSNDLQREVKSSEDKIAKLDEQIKAEQASKDKVLKLQEERRVEHDRLSGLKNLHEIKTSYDTHCKAGQGRAYCERTQASMRPGSGGKIIAAVGITSVATGLLLLFEELVPDTKANNGSRRIVKPGGY